MAKKKKKSSKKSEPVREPSSFWPLAGAIVMILLAAFLLLGGFGTGGPLPTGMFNAAYWLFGWGAYAVAPLLAFWGVLKFVSEDHQIPFNKLAAGLAFLILFASWLEVAFISTDPFGEYVNGHGGQVGAFVGGATLNILDKIPASIMFFVLALLAFFLTANISPKILMRIADLFHHDKEDTDLADLKQKAKENSFTMNEGVPVEHRSEAARLSSLKNTAQKLTPAQDHSALTAASDPSWKLPVSSSLIKAACTRLGFGMSAVSSSMSPAPSSFSAPI